MSTAEALANLAWNILGLAVLGTAIWFFVAQWRTNPFQDAAPEPKPGLARVGLHGCGCADCRKLWENAPFLLVHLEGWSPPPEKLKRRVVEWERDARARLEAAGVRL